MIDVPDRQLHFRRVSPADNNFKWYSIALDQHGDDLFSSPTITIRHGRIGQQGETIRRHFNTLDQAEKYFDSKARERMERGYVQADADSSYGLVEPSCILCSLASDPQAQSTFIAEFANSIFFLSWDQTYAGRSMILFRNHVPDFFRLAPSELLAILPEIRRAEAALTDVFASEMMNYLFMGNTAQHVHLHLVPRSRHDPNFGSSPFLDTQRVRGPQLSDSEYRAICEKIAASLG